MSRIAKAVIPIPAGVTVDQDGQQVTVKGPKGTSTWTLHPLVRMEQHDATLRFGPAREDPGAWAQAGTSRALINNMVIGVSRGFDRKLQLVGVGYRAQAQGPVLKLSLGFSHPVEFMIPEGLQVTTPVPTEILISGHDKQQVGQIAADIRSIRPPEPYKGKGVRYADEVVVRKETKKKK
jgi:large subunit ribosomal protein L6